MSDALKRLEIGMSSLVVFRSILKDKAVKKLMKLLSMRDSEISDTEYIAQYSGFAAELFSESLDLSEYLLRLVLENDNFFISACAQGQEADELLLDCVDRELLIIQQLSKLSQSDVLDEEYCRITPGWRTSDIDFVARYRDRLENIGCFGYGKWTKSNMFICREGKIVPVKHPDTQKLSELFGYERERREVVENTLALLEGRPALNTLLYGDAGTGKSSTVKAIANEFSDRGLRLIEITKEQLRFIPEIIDEISRNPLKFIIFIDDLSFTPGEDCFGALKAALEGSVSARGSNMVIYATSNRRHLVKERFSDREGDDVHRNDTMQENLSLSARFGLRVNFGRPDKDSYTGIACQLARYYGIDTAEDELALKAEQFALSSGNGRSPRTAKQFVHQMLNTSASQTTADKSENTEM